MVAECTLAEFKLYDDQDKPKLEGGDDPDKPKLEGGCKACIDRCLEADVKTYDKKLCELKCFAALSEPDAKAPLPAATLSSL
jgi:hypothetical protein